MLGLESPTRLILLGGLPFESPILMWWNSRGPHARGDPRRDRQLVVRRRSVRDCRVRACTDPRRTDTLGQPLAVAGPDTGSVGARASPLSSYSAVSVPKCLCAGRCNANDTVRSPSGTAWIGPGARVGHPAKAPESPAARRLLSRFAVGGSGKSSRYDPASSAHNVALPPRANGLIPAHSH